MDGTGAGLTHIAVSGVSDFAGLGARWRDLETRSAPSFFQSWTWMGCLARERFTDPVLVEAREDGRVVALALFNRRGRVLYLGESGDPSLDCPYIEYNGVLTETGREDALGRACMLAARSHGGWHKYRLVVSGLEAARLGSLDGIGAIVRDKSTLAPFISFTASNERFLDSRSANTRQQSRRSDRAFAVLGALTVERAATVPRAHEFLDGLATLHQATWTARGQPGSFARPFFRRFHRALIAGGLERGEIDLLKVSAGDHIVGFIYNFRFQDHVLAYQSGFNHGKAVPRGKPGLTCHLQAILLALGSGARRYDFLAGDSRYKKSLADRADLLHWVTVTDRFSPLYLARRTRDWARDVLRRRLSDASEVSE